MAMPRSGHYAGIQQTQLGKVSQEWLLGHHQIYWNSIKGTLFNRPVGAVDAGVALNPFCLDVPVCLDHFYTVYPIKLTKSVPRYV